MARVILLLSLKARVIFLLTEHKNFSWPPQAILVSDWSISKNSYALLKER
jgi:hypothetical protein